MNEQTSESRPIRLTAEVALLLSCVGFLVALWLMTSCLRDSLRGATFYVPGTDFFCSCEEGFFPFVAALVVAILPQLCRFVLIWRKKKRRPTLSEQFDTLIERSDRIESMITSHIETHAAGATPDSPATAERPPVAPAPPAAPPVAAPPPVAPQAAAAPAPHV